MNEYDLIVIGAGSGGVRAARISANYGAKVLVAEGLNYGGTCVNRGCVPKKLFTYAAQYNSDLNNARTYGWELPDHVPFNWQTLIKNKDKEIDRLNDIYKSILDKNNVERIDAFASFKDKETLIIDGKEFKGKKILIATGGVCNKQNYSAKDKILTSDDIFHIKQLPKDINWKPFDVDLVVESSGKFKIKESLNFHIKNGAKQVHINDVTQNFEYDLNKKV